MLLLRPTVRPNLSLHPKCARPLRGLLDAGGLQRYASVRFGPEAVVAGSELGQTGLSRTSSIAAAQSLRKTFRLLAATFPFAEGGRHIDEA